MERYYMCKEYVIDTNIDQT